jgi:chromate reductase, NAD(P)H dehydrogenase (quinone)
MRVLGLSGSLRAGSHNTRLLRVAAAALPPGGELVVFNGLRELPHYDDDALDAPPAAVDALRDAVREADAVLVATPEYNHSIPGVLKNALDWLSRPLATSPLKGKPVAVIGGSTGMFGAVWAQAETRKVLGAIGAHVVDRELPAGNVDELLLGDERLAEPGLQLELEALVGELSERTVPAPRSSIAA